MWKPHFSMCSFFKSAVASRVVDPEFPWPDDPCSGLPALCDTLTHGVRWIAHQWPNRPFLPPRLSSDAAFLPIGRGLFLSRFASDPFLPLTLGKVGNSSLPPVTKHPERSPDTAGAVDRTIRTQPSEGLSESPFFFSFTFFSFVHNPPPHP